MIRIVATADQIRQLQQATGGIDLEDIRLARDRLNADQPRFHSKRTVICMLTRRIGFGFSWRRSDATQRHSADQWATWLQEFERGDHTIAEFCKLKGVCTNSFYQWRKKLAAPDAVPAFVPVEVATSPHVEIDLPGGTTIRVPGDSESLRPVLQVLCELDANR